MTAAVPDLSTLPGTHLEAMAEAAGRVQECRRVLAKTGATVVSEILKDQGAFVPWDHYPAGDVYDRDSGAQYYFHAHPPEDRANAWGAEQGHFHSFLRPEGLAGPATHLIALSMNGCGDPVRLFTTNAWVTGEAWRPAEEVIGLLDRFTVDQALPSWPVNVWLTNMLRLFRPGIEDLLRRRDAALADWQRKHGQDRAAALADHGLEVTSILEIDVDRQAAAVTAALR